MRGRRGAKWGGERERLSSRIATLIGAMLAFWPVSRDFVEC